MINLLEDYIYKSLPESGDFSTNPQLRYKVDPNGNFLPFYGNTTVFQLSDETKKMLRQLQEELYQAAGEMLAQKLEPETFHMTLHDLVNGSQMDGSLLQRMTKAEQGAKAHLKRWRDQPPLHMKATALFNMVNTSIVLGLAPADKGSWKRLDEMYTALEKVVPLGYGLTPHITMAYYKPGTYSQQEAGILSGALCPVQLDVQLRIEDLVFQIFSDMDHYENK